MHLPVVDSTYDLKTGAYNFSQLFSPVAPYLKRADYTVVNLETRLAGPTHGYHGYPLFNTPADLAQHLQKAGVDLVATANNHSLDMGWDGIVSTLDNLDAAGLSHVGTYRSEAEKLKPFLVNVKGIKLAFLNYTASTNGLPLPPGKEFSVNLLDPAAVTAEAQAARNQGADLVIAVLHWGNEYQRYPDEPQRQLATNLFVYGVDIIIGSHPHVVQPIERITVQRDGASRDCIVAYSLGNFVSAQDWRYSDSGVILYLQIEKSDTGTFVRSVQYLPVWVQTRYVAGRERYRVLPVHPAINPATDIPLNQKNRERMTQVWEELLPHLNKPAQGIVPYKSQAVSTSTF
ncbi:MAG: CapA family protein [Firmicutes bacterium]|nr:CapA family protein [Bacillota bacterium]